jgi:DNA-binding NarL/FixJ family response regulator
MTPQPSRKAVYIVEDSSTITERLASLLRDLANVEILGISGKASQAIQEIKDLRPDIVTLDLQLIEGSGIDVLREVKKTPNPPTIIVLTNYADVPYRAHCQNLGADHFFDKAIDFPEVVDLISSWDFPSIPPPNSVY